MISMMINSVPVECINQAALTYKIPATLILSVMKKENGRNGDANKNKNGTYDYGVMQINDVWLPKIAGYGYSREDVQYNPCKNVLVATWILSQNIAAGKNIWEGIGHYYSHVESHSRVYQQGIYQNYKKILFFLNR